MLSRTIDPRQDMRPTVAAEPRWIGADALQVRASWSEGPTSDRAHVSTPEPEPKAFPGLKDGDVLLFQGRRLRDAVVRWLTGSAYTHVGLVLWSEREWYVAEATASGVELHALRELLAEYAGRVDHFEACHMDEGDRRRVRSFIVAQLGAAYGFLTGLVFMGLLALRVRALAMPVLARLGYRRPARSWLCGQLVAEAMASAGRPLWSERLNHFVAPSDFLKVPTLRFRQVLKP